MPYFIGSACADTTDRSCVEVCPVDCIYEGDRKLYIHPAECIDCGACETECPVEAIGSTLNLEDGDADHLADNAAFFETVLPGRSEPIGSPGGAQDIGRVGVDTPLAAALPAQDS